MKILKDIRIAADVDVKLLSKLLNVSTYAYIAYERGDRYIPDEIIPMIAKIYNIDKAIIENNCLDEKSLLMLSVIKAMNKCEKAVYLTNNLLGESLKLTYSNVEKVKKRIIKDGYNAKGNGITNM